MLREIHLYLVRAYQRFIKKQKGELTLTNTGFVKSICRVLEKLETNHFILPDAVYNTQRNTITNLLSLWCVYHLGRLETLPIPYELDSLRLWVEWMPTTLRAAKNAQSHMYHQSPPHDVWRFKQAGNMEHSVQDNLQGAEHFDVGVCPFWIFQLLWDSWRKFCQPLFLLCCSEQFCFCQVAWLVWNCIGKLISPENDSEPSLLYITLERERDPLKSVLSRDFLKLFFEVFTTWNYNFLAS